MINDYVMPRIRRQDTSAGFSIELQLKDHRIAQQLAHDVNVVLPINGTAITWWELMRSRDRSANDIADACFFSVDATGRTDAPALEGATDDGTAEG